MATPEEMAEAMRQNIPDKTGKSYAAWEKILHASKLEKHGELVKLLKSEHGVTHGFANLIATDFRSSGSPPSQDPVAAQYDGKEALRPVYDKLVAEVSKFGQDVEVSPKKAYVSLRRKKQFALIQPSTKTRIDIGLNLQGQKATKRLEESGSFNAMVTHRVRIADADEIDAQLVGWLKKAYGGAK